MARRLDLGCATPRPGSLQLGPQHPGWGFLLATLPQDARCPRRLPECGAETIAVPARAPGALDAQQIGLADHVAEDDRIVAGHS
jgi:enoyl-CoA hydratase/carnithine racemase